jgi:hypothetical protein
MACGSRWYWKAIAIASSQHPVTSSKSNPLRAFRLNFSYWEPSPSLILSSSNDKFARTEKPGLRQNGQICSAPGGSTVAEMHSVQMWCEQHLASFVFGKYW